MALVDGQHHFGVTCWIAPTVELYRFEPLRLHFADCIEICAIFGKERRAGIGGNSGASAAEELIKRHIRVFRGKVPQGNIHE